MANDETNDNKETNKEQPVFTPGMSLDKLKERFSNKVNKAKAKQFEGKFEAEYKKYDELCSAADAQHKILEKLWTEYNEGL